MPIAPLNPKGTKKKDDYFLVTLIHTKSSDWRRLLNIRRHYVAIRADRVMP